MVRQAKALNMMRSRSDLYQCSGRRCLGRGETSAQNCKFASTTLRRGSLNSRPTRAQSAAAAPPPVESDSAVLPAAPAKDVLMMKLGSTSTKAISSTSKPERVAVSELLPLIEKENPTIAPASSGLLEGAWQFRYCGSPAPGPVQSPTREIALLLYAGGYSPGLFGFEIVNKLPSSLIDIANVSVDIGGEQPRATVKADVSILGRKQTLTIIEELDAESETRLSERYVELDVLGRKVSLPTALRYSRSLYITYLDEDLLVIRDESGCPEILTKIVPEAELDTDVTDEVVMEDKSSTEDEGY